MHADGQAKSPNLSKVIRRENSFGHELRILHLLAGSHADVPLPQLTIYTVQMILPIVVLLSSNLCAS